jgi:hypothetical protein
MIDDRPDLVVIQVYITSAYRSYRSRRCNWIPATGALTRISTDGAQYCGVALQKRRWQAVCVTLLTPPAGKSSSHFGISSSACAGSRRCCRSWKRSLPSSVSAGRTVWRDRTNPQVRPKGHVPLLLASHKKVCERPGAAFGCSPHQRGGECTLDSSSFNNECLVQHFRITVTYVFGDLTPCLCKAGVAAPIRKCREATLAGADGRLSKTRYVSRNQIWCASGAFTCQPPRLRV